MISNSNYQIIYYLLNPYKKYIEKRLIYIFIYSRHKDVGLERKWSMWASLAPIHQIYKDPSILLEFNCRVHHFKINPDCLFEVFYRYLSKKEVFHRFLLLGDVYFCKYWGVCNSSNI